MKIALIRACGFGDAVQLTPLLQQIRADFPNCNITFFTTSSGLTILENSPLVDVIKKIDDIKFKTPYSFTSILNIFFIVNKKSPFDVIIDLQPGWTFSILTFLLKAKYKLGLKSDSHSFPIFTHLLQYPADGSGGGLHTSQYYINLWLKFSKKRDLLFSYNCLHLLNYTVPNSLFFPKAPFYCFVPNTGNTLSGGKHKQWPQEHWIKLGEALVQRGYTVVWLGGKEDHNWIPERAGFDIRMGNIYFQEIAVLMKKSKGVIAGDTGLFHLALALNVNAFGLYGPSSPTIVGPFRSPHGITIAKSELPCIHCMQLTCTHPEATKNMAYCLQLIKPEEVIQLLDLNFQ